MPVFEIESFTILQNEQQVRAYVQQTAQELDKIANDVNDLNEDD